MTHSLGMGGSERVITWLAAALAARGHEVSLLVMSPPETDFYPCDPRVQVLRTKDVRQACATSPFLMGLKQLLRSLGLGWVRLFLYARIGKRVRQLAEERRADVVVSLGTSMNLLVLLGLVGSGTAVVVSERSGSIHHDGLGFIQRRQRTRLYRSAHALVVQGQEAAERARREWGVTHAAIVPNAAPVLTEPPAPLLERPKTVLCVGRMQDIKDHLTLLRAWAASRAASRGWCLKIVGDGPLRVTLESVVNSLLVSKSVDLLGKTLDVMQNYATAQVFVLPSKSEGFPNALLEAMTHGCACLATECSGVVSELLGTGSSGVLVSPGDAVAMAGAIDALTGDPLMRTRLGDAAAHRAMEYGPDRVATVWERVLMDAVSRCRQQAR